MSLHKIVIAAGTASLAFLCLAGSRARADNVYQTPPPSGAVISKPATANATIHKIRQQVENRNENDGGCG